MTNLDMSLLTDEEQALFEALIGKIEPPKRRTPFVPKEALRSSNKLKPYNLKITYTCSTCGAKEEAMFRMTPSLDGSGLVSSRTTDVSIVADAVNSRNCKSCKNCREYLRNKDKEELISLYFRVVTLL